MAFDFNSCQLVGPDENRLGSGLLAPHRAVDQVETEVLRLASEWCWPGRAGHVPKPREKESRARGASIDGRCLVKMS